MSISRLSLVAALAFVVFGFVSMVPERATLLLLGSGLMVAAMMVRRWRSTTNADRT